MDDDETIAAVRRSIERGNTFIDMADVYGNGHLEDSSSGPAAERLTGVAATHEATVAQVALSWTLEHPTVTVAIAGAKEPSQVAENVGGRGWRLSPNDLRQIHSWLNETSSPLPQ